MDLFLVTRLVLLPMIILKLRVLTIQKISVQWLNPKLSGLFLHFLNIKVGHQIIRCEQCNIDWSSQENYLHGTTTWFEQHRQDSRLFCRLNKALYGLKQASLAWFHKLQSSLQNLGFVAFKVDASLFVKFQSVTILYVLVYVDDIIVTGSDYS